MRAFLLRLYPHRWRARYGDEFALVLEARPLGPLDVVDVALAALDAHRHYRGSGERQVADPGWSATRMGGGAAIVGSLSWFAGLFGASSHLGPAPSLWIGLVVVGSVSLLAGMIGLSARQARRHARLAWAAAAVPAVGAVLSAIGAGSMALAVEEPQVGGISAWTVWMSGTLALFAGSSLFAVEAWRTRTSSGWAAALLGLSATAVVPMAIGMFGGPVEVGQVLILVTVVAFSLGWAALGASALRIPPTPVPAPSDATA